AGGAGEVRRIRLCADPSNPPFSTRDASEPGFEVEIARAIADALGAELSVHWFPTEREMLALRQLYEGRCDLVMGLPRSNRFTDDKPWLAVTAPYYVMHQFIFAPIGAGVRANDNELKEAVERAIQQLGAKTLPEILSRYGIVLAQAEPPTAQSAPPTAAQPPSGAEPPTAAASPPTAPLTPELRAARSTYLTQCSQCHGTDAQGTPAAANLKAFKGSEDDFVRVVLSGRPGTAMTPWKGLIDTDDIRNIARYIKGL